MGVSRQGTAAGAQIYALLDSTSADAVEYLTACLANSVQLLVPLVSTLMAVAVHPAATVFNARLCVLANSTQVDVEELQRAVACHALACVPVDSMSAGVEGCPVAAAARALHCAPVASM